MNGAEDDDYLDAGLAAGAKDSLFEAVEELGQVMDIDAEVAKRLMQVTTVYGSHDVVPGAAPEAVLALLSGDGAGPVEVDPADEEAGGEARNFHIDVEVLGSLDQRFRFSSVVEPAVGEPARILAWRE